MYKKPDKLNLGDKIGIFVPSSPIKNSYRLKGLKKIKEMGYTAVEVRDILNRDGFEAKRAEEKFADFQDFFNDQDIKAIWAARGGYSSNYLLPLLSEMKIKKPKIVIGSSDVSYLLWTLLDQFNMVVFYGPMAYSSLAERRVNIEQFGEIMSGDYDEIRIKGSVIKHGQVEGIITGGCLSNFVSVIGTPYVPVVEQRILLLEDTGERPFRLDRMMWQLDQAGIFSKIKGLVMGEFPGCFKNKAEKGQFLDRVLRYVQQHSYPVIYNLPFGHSQNAHTIPLGIQVGMNTSEFPGVVVRDKGVS
jgi:muramoyltetrapeptide carboxypeptidase